MIPPRIENIKALDDFRMQVTYVNGETKVYDMNKNLKHKCYEKLKNIAYFKLAKSVGTTNEWPNGEDIDPNELYDNSFNIN